VVNVPVRRGVVEWRERTREDVGGQEGGRDWQIILAKKGRSERKDGEEEVILKRFRGRVGH
jgi:hypothetical protein